MLASENLRRWQIRSTAFPTEKNKPLVWNGDQKLLTANDVYFCSVLAKNFTVLFQASSASCAR